MAVTPSGKDKILRHVRLWIDELDVSGYSRTFSSCDLGMTEVDRHSWVDEHMHFKGDEQLVKGIRGWRSIMDAAATGTFENIKTQPDGIATMAFGGGGAPAIGDPAYLLAFKHIGLTAQVEAGLAVLEGDLIPDSGQLDSDAIFPLGRVHANEDDLGATTNHSSVDWERTDIADGGWATLHVLETSSGDYAFKLQHSTNDADWADISGGAFTLDGSSTGAELIGFSGSINRYTRLVSTRTAGTVDIVVAVALNIPYQDPIS